MNPVELTSFDLVAVVVVIGLLFWAVIWVFNSKV